MRGLKKLRVLLLLVALLCLLTVTASAAESKIVQAGEYELFLWMNEGGTWTVRDNGQADTDRGDLVIPSEVDGIAVTEIAEEGFENCISSGTLTLPEGLRVIGKYAFSNASFTGALTIPETVTNISEKAFYQCKGFTSLVLPEKLDILEESAFGYCTGITGELSLPVVTEIGYGAFSGCTGLTGDLIIPDGVQKIGSYAFYRCSGFNGSLSLPDSITYVSNSVFEDCSNLTGELVLPPNLNYVGSRAFYNLNKMTGSLCFRSNQLSRIGSGAFADCYNLDGILELPAAVTGELVIGDEAFSYCNDLSLPEGQNLVIPEGTTKIGTEAFHYCENLEGGLVIPDSVESIGYGAFSYCKKLNGNLRLPSGLTKIGKDTFRECKLTGTLDIPADVTEIGEYAFYGCNFTGKLELPPGLTQINKYTFYNMSGFSGPVDIPDGVTSIGEYAFYNCSGLTGKLDIPEYVTSIGRYAFCNCSGFEGKLELPSGLTKIESSCFNGCSGLTGTLYLSDTITEIESSAFSACSGLQGLILPKYITEIDYGTFSGCTGFQGELEIPEGVTRIGQSAFSNCSGFTGHLLLPEGLKIISISAFSNCSGFTGTLDIPDTLEVISSGAFSGCSGFTGDLRIPAGITRLEGYTFNNCTGLDGCVVIPYSVEEVESHEFANCSNIKSVYWPTGVIFNKRYSFERVFENCSNLKDLYFGGTEDDPLSVSPYGQVNKDSALGILSVTTIHYNSYPAKELTLPGSNLSYRVGQTVTLEANYAADEIAEDLSFSWSSSHPDVVKLIDSSVEIKGKGYAAKVTATFEILKESSSEITVSGPFGLSDTCVVNGDDLKELTFVPQSGQSMTEANAMEPGETMDLLFSYRSYSPVAEDLDDFTWKTLVNGVENNTVVSLSNVLVEADGEYAATLTAKVTADGYGGPVDIVVSGPGESSAKCTVVVPQDKLTILGPEQTEPEGVLHLRKKVAEPFTVRVRYETDLQDEEQVARVLDSLIWETSAAEFFDYDENEHILGTETVFTPEVTWEKEQDGVYLLQTVLTPALEGVTALKVRTAENENGASTSDVCLVYASFDVESYLAELYERTDEIGERLPAAEGLDQYLYKLDAPSQLIIKELEKDLGFIGSVAAWEALDVVFKTLDNPAAAYMEYTVRESDIYYALLLELLRGAVEEYTDLAALQATEYGGSVINFVQDAALMISHVDLTDSHAFSKWLMTDGVTMSQNTFGEKMEIPGLINDFASVANVFVGTMNDYGQAITNAAIVEQVTDSMTRVLEAMLAECPADAKALQEALTNCLTQVNKTGDELRQDAELGLIFSAGKRGYAAIFDKVWDGLMDDVKWSNPEVAAFCAAYAAGSTVCKEMGNTDDTVETYYKMLALEDIREVARKAEETLNWAWHEDTSSATAAEYLCALDLLYRVQREDLETAQDFAQALIDAPEYGFSGDPEKMEAALASFKEYGTNLDNHYRVFREMWMTYFREDYPHALLDVQYEDLFADATGIRPTRVVVVACPVSVRVLDRAGNEAAYVGKDRVSCAAEDISVALAGEEKHIFFYGGSYTLQYEGYDEGTMNVTDRTFDSSGELKQEVRYYDLPVEAGQIYRAAQMGNLRDPGGSYVAPHSDSADYAGYTVTVVNGVLERNGFPVVRAQAHAGQRFTLTAPTAMNGKPFKGWTSNMAAVIADPSSPVTTVIMPGKDVVITAEYGEDIAGELTDEDGTPLTGIPSGVFKTMVRVPDAAEQCLLAGYDGAGRLVWIGESGIENDTCTFTVDNTRAEIAELRFFALTGTKAPAQGPVKFPGE